MNMHGSAKGEMRPFLTIRRDVYKGKCDLGKAFQIAYRRHIWLNTVRRKLR